VIQRQVRSHVIGSFAAAALARSTGAWRVLATFPTATYLTDGTDTVVLTARDVAPGPIHVTTGSDLVAVDPRDEMVVTADRLVIGAHTIDISETPQWLGSLPAASDLLTVRETLGPALDRVAGTSALAAEPFAARARSAFDAAGRRGPDAMAELLIGLGPGLTPAGDDALAGFLIVSIAMGRIVPGSWRMHRTLARRTNAMSRAYIQCAAEGQAIAHVHHVLLGAARGDRAARDAACHALAGVGGTSGADIAFGMSAGLSIRTDLARTH